MGNGMSTRELYLKLLSRLLQICVTLFEWEHVADPFANATHYLEKALYKTLSQLIVPAIVEELRVRCHTCMCRQLLLTVVSVC